MYIIHWFNFISLRYNSINWDGQSRGLPLFCHGMPICKGIMSLVLDLTLLNGCSELLETWSVSKVKPFVPGECLEHGAPDVQALATTTLAWRVRGSLWLHIDYNWRNVYWDGGQSWKVREGIDSKFKERRVYNMTLLLFSMPECFKFQVYFYHYHIKQK